MPRTFPLRANRSMDWNNLLLLSQLCGFDVEGRSLFN